MKITFIIGVTLVVVGLVLVGIYLYKKRQNQPPYIPPYVDPLDKYDIKYDFVEQNPNWVDADIALIPNTTPQDCAFRCNSAPLCDAFVFNPLGSTKIPGSVNVCVLKTKTINPHLCVDFWSVEKEDKDKGIFIACKK